MALNLLTSKNRSNSCVGDTLTMLTAQLAFGSTISILQAWQVSLDILEPRQADEVTVHFGFGKAHKRQWRLGVRRQLLRIDVFLGSTCVNWLPKPITRQLSFLSGKQQDWHEECEERGKIESAL